MLQTHYSNDAVTRFRRGRAVSDSLCTCRAEHCPRARREPEPLDDDLKRLCDFGVVSGGIIVIEQGD